MTNPGAPTKDIQANSEKVEFGFNLDALRLKLGDSNFHKKSNEKCQSESLVKRYPDRYSANHGDFHLSVQLADKEPISMLDIDEDHAEKIEARIWLYGKDKTSSQCFFLAEDGNWYIRTSEKSPRIEKGVNYWNLGETRLAEKSDINLLKAHFNSFKSNKLT